MIRLVGLLLATSIASQAASPVNLWNSDKNKLSVSGLDATTPLSPALLDEEDAILCYSDDMLHCHGAKLSSTPWEARQALSIVGYAAPAVILPILAVDVPNLVQTRHARTLTALLRARLLNMKESVPLLILTCENANQDVLLQQVQGIYSAVAVEKDDAPASLDQVFDVKVASSVDEAKQMIASATLPTSSETLSSALMKADAATSEADVASMALDTPSVAAAFLSITTASTQQSRRILAATTAWNSRVLGRNLAIDDFGTQASDLYATTLQAYDEATRLAAAVPTTAQVRKDERMKLEEQLKVTITRLYEAQIGVLTKVSQRRLERSVLLPLVNSQDFGMVQEKYAQGLEEEVMRLEAKLQKLAVPALELSGVVHESVAKLSQFVQTFPDSPIAQVARTHAIKKVVNRERSPTQRALSWGLDLVAVLRPDGFGNLQGFAGYQLTDQYSMTFGIHNDADDPSTIAQYGSRPPLLRVQPKLKLNVEM